MLRWSERCATVVRGDQNTDRRTDHLRARSGLLPPMLLHPGPGFTYTSGGLAQALRSHPRGSRGNSSVLHCPLLPWGPRQSPHDACTSAAGFILRVGKRHQARYKRALHGVIHLPPRRGLACFPCFRCCGSLASLQRSHGLRCDAEDLGGLRHGDAAPALPTFER